MKWTNMVHFLAGEMKGLFSLCHCVQIALGTPHPSLLSKGSTRNSSLGVKWLKHEADY